MAVVQLQSGDTITIGGISEVFGTAGTQSVTVLDGSNITFRSGFNAGNTDAVRLTGQANNFNFSVSGSNAVLTSAVDGITITIPVGTNGTNITFDNGDTRLLVFNGTNVVLGAQVATATPTPVPPGPAVYSITGAVQGIEGTDYVFTATRTTDGVNAAQVLTFNVQGDTNGGTVPAATSGLDWNTAAGNTVTFAAGSLVSAPFLVRLNTDNLVEGLEGIRLQLFNGATVLATTTGLIADANKVGQTFTATTSIDTVGSGTALDLVGSEGSTSVVGQDKIVVTENTATTFDNFDGGPDLDTLVVLDAGSFFTVAPNFTNITVKNIETMFYTSVRGLNAGALNTTAWTGLQNATLLLNSAATQTLTEAAGMTGTTTITNAGNGGVTSQGGGGTLVINATQAGNVNVGQNATSNTWTSATVNGGNNIAITDNGAQELASATLNGFAGNATLTGNALANVSISNINGGTHTATINNVNAVTVALAAINVTNLDLISTGANLLTVNSNAAGGISGGQPTAFSGNIGMGDITAGGNIVINASGGNSFFDDITTGGTTVTLNDLGGGIGGGNVQGVALSTLTINGTTGGTFSLDTLDGTNTAAAVFNVNVTGNAAVNAIAVVEAAGGTVITSTSSGGVFVLNTLSNNTLFNGSGDTGADNIAFGSTIRQQTLGGGNDVANFNAALMGSSGAPAVFGSIDGGAGFDQFWISQANAQSLTAQGNFLSNFEQAVLTGGSAAGVTNTVNTANLGFSANNTNVIVTGANSGVATQEVTTITFSGTATGMVQGSAATVNTADTMLFDGVTTIFDDTANAAAQAADFVATYNAAVGKNWTAVNNGGGSVTLTKNLGGTSTDLTTGSFVFTDVQNVGAPSGTVGGKVDGTLTGGVNEQATLTLNNVAVANGETVTVDTGGGNPAFTYTNTTGGTLLGSNGSGGNPPINASLGNAIKAAADADADFSAVYNTAVVNGDVVFTAKNQVTLTDLTLNGPASTGLTAPADNFAFAVGTQGNAPTGGTAETFTWTVVGAGNAIDTITFDGVTTTLNGTENTNEAVAARFVGFSSTNWTATVLGNVVTFTNKANGNVTDVTNASFVIVDDTNIGTPSISSVVTNTQGDAGGLILNSVTNNASLELQGDGLYTVNLLAQAVGGDTLNLLLSGGRIATVNAAGVETVIVNTDTDVVTSTDNLTLNDTALASITISGNDNLNFSQGAGGVSTAVTVFNAGGNSGAVNWTSGALANAVTVTGAAGGGTINLLAATKAITFNGTGSGADVLVLGNANSTTVNLGGGADTVTTGTGLTNSITVGTGHDTVIVTQTLNGNSYSKVADFTAASFGAAGGSGDRLTFAAGADAVLGVFNATKVPSLQPTASFQDYLDAATAGGPGVIRWFVFDSGVGANGNTYVVDDNSAATTFQNGIDNVIELTGTLNLASYAGAGTVSILP